MRVKTFFARYRIMKKSLLITIILCIILAPATAMARKKKKKYEKKEVSIEQTIVAEQTPTPLTITNPAEQLYGEWNIISIRKKPISTRERAYIYLDFASHKVYGNNGCNTMNGTFKQNGNDIIFKDFITTEASCHNATGERTIMKTLSEVQHYSLSILYQVEYLNLLNSKGQVLMTLRRQNLDLLNGAWIVKEVEGNNILNANVRLVIDAVMNTIHGNTGCNIINGIITIDPEKDFAIQFEDLHSSGNDCDNIDNETAVLIALEQTEACKRINDNEVGFLDGKGRIVLVLSRINVKR